MVTAVLDQGRPFLQGDDLGLSGEVKNICRQAAPKRENGATKHAPLFFPVFHFSYIRVHKEIEL